MWTSENGKITIKRDSCVVRYPDGDVEFQLTPSLRAEISKQMYECFDASFSLEPLLLDAIQLHYENHIFQSVSVPIFRPCGYISKVNVQETPKSVERGSELNVLLRSPVSERRYPTSVRSVHEVFGVVEELSPVVSVEAAEVNPPNFVEVTAHVPNLNPPVVAIISDSVEVADPDEVGFDALSDGDYLEPGLLDRLFKRKVHRGGRRRRCYTPPCELEKCHECTHKSVEELRFSNRSVAHRIDINAHGYVIDVFIRGRSIVNSRSPKNWFVNNLLNLTQEQEQAEMLLESYIYKSLKNFDVQKDRLLKNIVNWAILNVLSAHEQVRTPPSLQSLSLVACCGPG